MPGPSFTFQKKFSPRQGIFARFGGLLVASILVLFVIVGVWGGSFLAKKAFEDRQARMREDTQALRVQLSGELQDVLRFPSQVASVEKLTRNHVHGSKIFDFFRSYTLANVRVAGLDIEQTGGNWEIRVNGEATDFTALAQQIILLKSVRDVRALTVGKAELSEAGRVTFTITMHIAPSFFTLGQS